MPHPSRRPPPPAPPVHHRPSQRHPRPLLAGRAHDDPRIQRTSSPPPPPFSLQLTHPQDVSAAALYLIAKVGPSPVTPRDIALVYTYLLSPSSSFLLPPSSPPPPNDPPSYHLSDAAYQSFHTRLLALEARLLYALAFDTHVALPHPLAITYLQALDFLGLRKETVARRAVEYLNTALLSPQMLYLTSQPNALAVAAVYNAARDVGGKMPECEWWEVFDVEREELGFLVMGMRSLEVWAGKMREGVLEGWKGGMVTRGMVEGELGRRGIRVERNGGVDAEEELARRMDQRMEAGEDSA